MDKERALYLIQRYREQIISETELNELRQWMREQENSPLIKEAIETDILDHAAPETISAETLDRIFANVIRIDKAKRTAPVRRIWIRWVAAACILALVGVLAWLTVGVPANNRNKQTATTHDVPAPKETRAVITLANGSKVYLDSLGDGVIAQENNVNVVKNEGGIEYRGQKSEVGGQVAYNTLSNPGGSKIISLTLGDGTKVWLNSESSLRYPASFSASSAFREVEITGEAYFEVKHNAKQPFRVQLPNGAIVEDIGTSFNINAYPDEDATKTTLIEGSVRVKSEAGGKKSEVIIKPGEQVIDKQNSPLTIHHSPDIDEVMAWKNGVFQMNNTDVGAIMRQIARWYDVDVAYENGIPGGHITGKVPRNTNLLNVLKVLEYSGLKFSVSGRKITVLK